MGLRFGESPNKDKFWFEITTDPHTIEIKTKPSTAKQLAKQSSRVQRDIFDVAHKLGTTARYEEGSAAHMHIGTKSAFGNNAMKLRNFLVDYSNFPLLLVAPCTKTTRTPRPLLA